MAILRIFMYSLIALIIFIVQPGSSLFSWHPTLLTIGSMFFMYEAIVIFKPKKGLLEGKSYETKLNGHAIMQSLALILMLTGFTAVVMHKNSLNKSHFTSPHAICGCIALILGCCQAVGGVLTRFPMLTPLPAKYMKLGHAISGACLYLFTCLAVIGGIMSNYMSERTYPSIQAMLLVLPMATFATSVTKLLNELLTKALQPKRG